MPGEAPFTLQLDFPASRKAQKQKERVGFQFLAPISQTRVS